MICSVNKNSYRFKHLVSLILLFLLLACSSGISYGSTYGYVPVFQLDINRSIHGELMIVEDYIFANGMTSPHNLAYGVFAKRVRAVQEYNFIRDENNMIVDEIHDGFEYEQRNRAYCEGLDVQIIPNDSDKNRADVYLDYSECRDELAQIKFKSELDNIIDGTGAALIYTYHHYSYIEPVTDVVLHIKGFRGHPEPFDKEYVWGQLNKKWKYGPDGDEAVKATKSNNESGN